MRQVCEPAAGLRSGYRQHNRIACSMITAGTCMEHCSATPALRGPSRLVPSLCRAPTAGTVKEGTVRYGWSANAASATQTSPHKRCPYSQPRLRQASRSLATYGIRKPRITRARVNEGDRRPCSSDTASKGPRLVRVSHKAL